MMRKNAVTHVNALPAKVSYGAVRARKIRFGAYAIEAALPCINGLSAWFTIATVHPVDDAEIFMTEGAIGTAEEIAETIARALDGKEPQQ
jgi:hypothetical protein